MPVPESLLTGGDPDSVDAAAAAVQHPARPRGRCTAAPRRTRGRSSTPRRESTSLRSCSRGAGGSTRSCPRCRASSARRWRRSGCRRISPCSPSWSTPRSRCTCSTRPARPLGRMRSGAIVARGCGLRRGAASRVSTSSRRRSSACRSREIDADAQAAAASGFFGRKKRLIAVRDQLAPVLRPGATVKPKRLTELTGKLVELDKAVRALAAKVSAIPGLVLPPGWSPFSGGRAPRARRAHRPGAPGRPAWSTRRTPIPERARFAPALQAVLATGVRADPRRRSVRPRPQRRCCCRPAAVSAGRCRRVGGPTRSPGPLAAHRGGARAR